MLRRGARLTREVFVARLASIGGAPTALWLPKQADTTTNVSYPDTRTWTHANTQAGRYTAQGFGALVSFNGTTDLLTTPDANELSFPEPAPFSVVSVVNPSALTSTRGIYTRLDFTTGNTKREIWFAHDATLKLFCRLYDESAGAYIGRKSAVSLSNGTTYMLSMTYSGSGAASGIKLYNGSTQVDNANDSSGVYVAMENTATLSRIGNDIAASGSGENWWSGSMGLVAVFSAELTATQLGAMRNLTSEYYGVPL